MNKIILDGTSTAKLFVYTTENSEAKENVLVLPRASGPYATDIPPQKETVLKRYQLLCEGLSRYFNVYFLEYSGQNGTLLPFSFTQAVIDIQEAFAQYINTHRGIHGIFAMCGSPAFLVTACPDLDVPMVLYNAPALIKWNTKERCVWFQERYPQVLLSTTAMLEAPEPMYVTHNYKGPMMVYQTSSEYKKDNLEKHYRFLEEHYNTNNQVISVLGGTELSDVPSAIQSPNGFEMLLQKTYAFIHDKGFYP